MKILKYVLTVILTVLCLVCAGTCVYLMTQVLELRQECEQLESENTANESALSEVRTSLEEEQERSAALESELEIYQEAAVSQTEAQTETVYIDDNAAVSQTESAIISGTEDSSETSSETESTVITGDEDNPDSASSGYGTSTALTPGAILTGVSSADDVSEYFTSAEIVIGDDVYERIYGKSYQDNDNISLEDLRYLIMLHYNFDHEVQVGEMIVHKNIEDEVLSIFQELFAVEYEIQSMYLIDNYWTGDAGITDTASIEENNTSCFNYRAVTGGSSLSRHAYGCAIDINPQQNPYVTYSSDGSPVYYHDNAAAYIDRDSGADHMILAGDICYNTFAKYGFSWGGDWSSVKDYQHFEISAY